MPVSEGVLTERQQYQCMGCAWANPYSPRDHYGMCEECHKGIARMKDKIARKRAERVTNASF